MTGQRKLGEPMEPGDDSELAPQWKDPDNPDDYVQEATCDEEPVTDEEDENTGASQ